MAQEEADHDDGEDSGGADLLGRRVGDEGDEEGERVLQERVAEAPAQPVDRDHEDQADTDAAEGRERELPQAHAAQLMPSPTAAARATLYAVMAVASFTRDSPWRMVVIRFGRPSLRAMAVAATASGGATTAPSTRAAVSGRSGTRTYASQPTATVAKRTYPTESSATGRMLARRSRYEESTAAV